MTTTRPDIEVIDKDQIIKNLAHYFYDIASEIPCSCNGDIQKMCDICHKVLAVDVLMDKSGVHDE